jgi:hypothetical protein
MTSPASGTNPSCSPDPNVTAYRQVATLSTVIEPDFAKGAIMPTDAALVLPGKVSSSILSSPVFSSAVLTFVKKGLKVQKEGACKDFTSGHVITKMLVPVRYKICLQAAVKRNSQAKSYAKITAL